ncbi:unnamed protein product [Heterobilharzia americana]|nr:unnamed protein product [Heterobilharzia americana]
MIFLIVVDWIMQQTVGSPEKMGIRWTTENNLEDLDITNDDLCLMSHKLEDLQAITNKLSEEAGQRRKTGLQVNIEKTEVMKIPNKQHQQQQQQRQTPININGRNLMEVDSSTYLGSTVSTTGGGTDNDVKASQDRKDSKTGVD